MSVPPCRLGRKRIYPYQFTVYLDDEAGPAVRAFAAKSRVTIAVALRELIEIALEEVADGQPL